MQPRDHQVEARRWAKFPATVLLATGLLWLLQNYFELDWLQIKEQSESLVGAIVVFTALVLVPLGSVASGLGLLFLQRWALWSGFVLPVIALAYLSGEKAQSIARKFAEFRASGEVESFGGGVMTALLLVALWAVYILIVTYLLKVLKQLELADGWARRRPDASSTQGVSQHLASGSPAAAGDDEYCFLLPDPADEAQE